MAEFRVLGPIEAWHDGAQVPLGSRRQRLLFAVLLLADNRVVSSEDLIAALWGESPPPSARAMVHTRVSALRGILARDTGGEARVVRQPPGYALHIDPMKLDAHRFARLVETAQAEHDDRDRRRLFREAMGLWRGSPLGGWAPPAGAVGLIGRLESMRLTAAEELFDAELRLGNHRSVVDEIAALAAAHPARERLTGQLMLALARGDRGADALRAYEECRRWLADELGTVPGPELRRVHGEILRGDARRTRRDPVSGDARPARRDPVSGDARPTRRDRVSGDARPTRRDPAGGGARRPPPAQLPADVAGFVGRAAELAGLDEALAGPGPPAAAVTGPPGVGKTAVALHWAHSARARFPDGQLFADLRGFGDDPALRAEVLLDRFLRALGVPAAAIPTDQDELAAEFRSVLAGRRVLLVLDNAASSEQVRPLLPGTGPSRVLITSRDRLDGLAVLPGIHRVLLGPLTDAESIALVRPLVGLPGAAGNRAARRLVAICDRLPLALRITMARLDADPGRLAGALADERTRLDGLAVEDGRLSVRAAISASLHRLDAPARRTFRLLGLHPAGTPSLGAAAALSGEPPETVRCHLDRLVAVNLVASPAPGCYALHDLVRLYAREQASDAGRARDHDAAVGRMLTWYRDVANGADRILRPSERPNFESATRPLTFADDAAAVAWFDAEATNLTTVVEHAAERRPEFAWQIAAAMYGWLVRRQHRNEWIVLYRLAARAAVLCADSAGEALLVGRLAIAYASVGQVAPAVAACERAYEIRKRLGDRLGAATALLNLSATHLNAQQPDRALRWLTEAEAIGRDLPGNAHLRAMISSNLGEAHHLLGDLDDALAYYQTALKLSEELHAERDIAQILIGIGKINQERGRPERAIAHFARARNLALHTGDTVVAAEAQKELGIAYADTGDRSSAQVFLTEAIAAYDRLGHGDADRLRDRLRGLSVRRR